MFVVFWVVPCGACASDRVSGERSDRNTVGSEALRLHTVPLLYECLSTDTSKNESVPFILGSVGFHSVGCNHVVHDVV